MFNFAYNVLGIVGVILGMLLICGAVVAVADINRAERGDLSRGTVKENRDLASQGLLWGFIALAATTFLLYLMRP